MTDSRFLEKMRRIGVILMVLGGSLASQSAFAVYDFAMQVEIESGTIEGNFDTETNIKKFFGVPYAQPPVGELRWRPPQPVEAWEDVKETKAFGPSPIQYQLWGDAGFRSKELSEDCLYLNVWTPADRNTTGLPVLVYYYGGDIAGGASEPRYDGEAMAREGIVVVTANHRLNLFGFLCHPDLTAESSYNGSGNYGLLDQVAVLQWVVRNIEAFGGDPERIIIAGESAGALSVNMQMVSPLTKDLIAGAIGQSGSAIDLVDEPLSLEAGEAIGREYLKNAGYSSIAELRALSTRDLYEIYREAGDRWLPIIIDGYFLTEFPEASFRAGKQAQVPLLAGWNSAELPAVAFMQEEPFEPAAFIAKVKEAYPDHHEAVLELYPHATPAEVEQSATDLASDRFLNHSTWMWLVLHGRQGDAPVYRYFYDRIPPQPGDSNLLGAPHACEIEYAMGNLYLTKDRSDWQPGDYATSEAFFGYFANFIKTGNPNGAGLPQWPPLDPENETPQVMVIDVESKAIPAPDDARYRLLESIRQ
jgi:para-nitrobenzyl esterase